MTDTVRAGISWRFGLQWLDVLSVYYGCTLGYEMWDIQLCAYDWVDSISIGYLFCSSSGTTTTTTTTTSVYLMSEKQFTR